MMMMQWSDEQESVGCCDHDMSVCWCHSLAPATIMETDTASPSPKIYEINEKVMVNLE